MHPTTSETYPSLSPSLRIPQHRALVVVVAVDLALVLMSIPVAASDPALALVLSLAHVSVHDVDIVWYIPTCPSTRRDWQTMKE